MSSEAIGNDFDDDRRDFDEQIEIASGRLQDIRREVNRQRFTRGDSDTSFLLAVLDAVTAERDRYKAAMLQLTTGTTPDGDGVLMNVSMYAERVLDDPKLVMTFAEQEEEMWRLVRFVAAVRDADRLPTVTSTAERIRAIVSEFDEAGE